MNSKDILPRNIRLDELGKIIIEDNDKIICNEDCNDKLLIKNVLKGKIISSNIYPLIYDNGNYRSIVFYEEVIIDNNKFTSLDEENKLQFVIGIRDLYMAYQMGILNDEEIKLLKNIINLIDDDYIFNLNINGLDISPYPLKEKNMVRFISINDIQIDDNIKNYFIICDNLYMLYISPHDLSYHNFENIINLNNDILSIYIDGFHKHISKEEIYEFKFTHYSLYLDKSYLYDIPINNNSRGGKRYIFKSDSLAENITDQLKVYFGKDFITVNNVFRFNKFKSNDKKFVSHYDTPYYDNYNKHSC